MRRDLTTNLPADELAIERIREFEGVALTHHPAGYWLAFSGGKDSVVILDLAKRAGVKFTAHYNPTNVDPPELVRFIHTFPEIGIKRPAKSMWQLIRDKRGPPRRNARWCCEALKECGGAGRLVMTGIRWAESPRRAKRRLLEPCFRDKTKHYLHPIIDWSTEDVWGYIRGRPLRYCSLYDEGFKRLGCVLCPMTRNTAEQIARWPKLCAAWERFIKATWQPVGKRHGFATPEAYWRWWLDRDSRRREEIGALVLFDDPGLEEARAGERWIHVGGDDGQADEN